MKRLLPLLLLLFSINAIAQDYACIIPTDTSYFINAGGYLRGIRIDDVQVAGTDTLYYPFKTNRHFTAAFPGVTFDTSRGCWLGKQIDKQPNGIFKFHSFWLDTVFVDTKAMPGDSWIFYNDTTSRHYLATVMSIDTMTIKGDIDSVKKIQITAYLGSSVNFGDPVHGFQILLSKNHGFASVFDLYMFPYFSPTGATFPDVFSEQIGAITYDHCIFKQVEFHVPTLKEIYDFHIGDVFVSSASIIDTLFAENNSNYDSVTSISVINPMMTVFTTFRKSRYYSDYHEGAGAFVADTTKAFLFPFMPEEYYTNRVWHYFPDDTTYCTAGHRYRLDDIVIFEGGPHAFEYKTGFPRLFSISSTPPLPGEIGYHSIEGECLAFSVKSHIPCGHRADVTPVATQEILKTRNQILIYPNPAHDKIHVYCMNEPGLICVLDITGRQIINTYSTANETSIDISQLAPGPYIIRVSDMRQKFIKQ